MRLRQIDVSPEAAQRMAQGTASAHLGIEILEFTDDSVRGRMPVDHRTIQPAGVLHGGLSAAFAETLASLGAACAVDHARFHCVGQEINANHIRAVSQGWVYGEARPLHLGRSSHVWEIRITNEAGQLVCVSRMTIAVLARPSDYGTARGAPDAPAA